MERQTTPLEWLEPPARGLDEVFGRIRRRRRHRAVAACLGAVALVAGVVVGTMQPGRPAIPEALMARIESRERRPGLEIINGTALELASLDSGGRVYLVSTAGTLDVGGASANDGTPDRRNR